ncbi:MAG: SDR family NAD(P)-dependent oxidoreductase [Taibaiella sp.]|nr:SDR family NAD(P)-dependent oxidoreductase [Taibaiella sp.]
MNLNAVNVLITGGANGIGHAISTSLAGKVAQVIVIDRDARAVAELNLSHPAIRTYIADITNIDEVKNVTDKLYNDVGKINVLVNNAGIIHSEPLINLLSKEDAKHSIENWQRTINVNLNAVFYVTVHIAEKMVKNRHKGVIINISSITSKGNVGQSAYSATKSAVNALTVTWSKELGMFGIRCNSIAPGFMDTASTHNALSESKVKAYQKATPLGRLGKTEELVKSVEFIIENDFYNGTVLELDGGLTL